MRNMMILDFRIKEKKQKGNFDESDICFSGDQKGGITLQNQELNDVFKIEKEERSSNQGGNGNNYNPMMGNHNFPIMGSSSNSDTNQSNARYYSDLATSSQQESSYSPIRNDKIQQELNQLSKQFNFRYASRDGDDPCIIECATTTHYNLPVFFIRVPLNYPDNLAEIDLPSNDYDWGSAECQIIKKNTLEYLKGNNTNYIPNLLCAFLDALSNRHS